MWGLRWWGSGEHPTGSRLEATARLPTNAPQGMDSGSTRHGQGTLHGTPKVRVCTKASSRDATRPGARCAPRPRTSQLTLSHTLTSRVARPARSSWHALEVLVQAAPSCLAAVSAMRAAGGECGRIVEGEGQPSPAVRACGCAACAEISGPAREAHAHSIRTCSAHSVGGFA